MAKVAPQANLWYNKGLKLLSLGSVPPLPRTMYNLVGGYTMTTISPCPQDGNLSPKCCTKCKQSFPATTEFFYGKKAAKSGLRSECKTCTGARVKIYYAQNKEHLIECNRQYVSQNKEKRSEYDRQYNHNNPEKRREGSRKYLQTERGKMANRAHRQTRRARRRNAQGSHTLAELQGQYLRQKGCCYYCGVRLGESRNSYHADHVVPLSRGGTNDISNIVMACSTCNNRKHNKLPHEWGEGGRLL